MKNFYSFCFALFLLIAGIADMSAATKAYKMIFERQMVAGSGYTVNAAYKGDGTNGLKITSDDDSDVLEFEAASESALPEITTNNISTYITARSVTGYTTSFYVNTSEAGLGYKGNIYINYVTTATTSDSTYTWNDGTYQYSRIYTRQTGSTILLPEDEVAISLYLNHTETVMDTIAENSLLWSNPSSVPTKTINGIKYHYIGQQTNGFGGGAFFYERTRSIKNSTLENVVIPRETEHDGLTYKVTAIQKWGFCYDQTDQRMVAGYYSNPNNCNPNYYWGCIDDHSNWYLKSLRFEYPSNVRSVGDYAFMSCVYLQSAVLPSSIEYLGRGIFEMCESLKDMRFETITSNDLKPGEGQELIGTVRFNTIKNFTFWLCTSLETLELPDGITDIEGQKNGAALQYMLKLINLRLPNTLERVGAHFLCCAMSLKNLTIPASVKYIDGAAFHGCQGLENVYLLGPAAALQLSGSGANTFAKNTAFCAGDVQNTTFWTPKDYLESYQNDPVWSLIDQDGNTNWLKELPEETRSFEAGKWSTAIFPHVVPDAYAAYDAYDESEDPQDIVKNGFGEGTKVAVMESATVSMGTDPNSGEPINLYNITFRLLADNQDGTLTIPADTPVLICPGHSGNHVMYTYVDQEDEEFKARMSIDYTSYVNVNNSRIDMKGRYTPHHLMPWDFYFMYNNNDEAKFWRVATQENAPTIKSCRCWWTLVVNGARTDGQAVASQGAKFFKDFEDDATAIKDVDVENIVVKVGVYDIQGRKLNMSEGELPQGMFIVNGKKVLVK